MACGHAVEVNGVTTTVREARPDDVDRLLDLYGRLSPEDTHRRFFSGFRPDRAWIERWIVRSDGGVVLVAVEGDEDTGLAVADAGYVPTGADIAELAMTVDPHRRLWLGPFMLDALVEHARARGFRNLEAEVLSTNRAMLAVLRARGCALRPSRYMRMIDVIIGTVGAAPSWPTRSGRPRILVEGSSSAWRGARAAEEAGMGVLACPGPERGRMRRCPLLSGEPCPLVDGADSVVVALPQSSGSTEELIAAHATNAPGRPIVVTRALHEQLGDVEGRPTIVLDDRGDSGEADGWLTTPHGCVTEPPVCDP